MKNQNELIIERIKSLCDKNKISINKLLHECELNKSVIDNMKKGSVPSSETISKIADYFNVSTDYLLCKTDNSAPPGKGIQPETEQNPLINKILKVLPNPTNEEFEKLIDYARYIDSSRDE